MTKMSRRQLLMVGSAAATTYGLAACSGSSERSDGSSKGPVLVGWGGNPTRDPLVNSALDAAQTKLGITIKRESGSGEQFGDKINAQLAAGGGPDVWITQILALANFTSKGAAYNLDKYVGHPIDMSDWDKQAILGGQVRGHQYSISTGSNTFMAVYDESLVPEDARQALKPGWTWDELMTIGPEVAKAHSGVALVGDMSADIQSFQVWIRSYGGELWDTSGKFLPSVDQIVEYWDYWAKLRKAGSATSAEVAAKFSTGGDITQSGLALKKAAMAFDFSNRLTAFEGLVGKTLKYTTYPQARRPGMFVRPSLLWMVGGKSAHADEAAKLINLLVNDPDVCGKLQANLGLPDNPKIFANMRSKAKPADRRVFDYVAEAKQKYTTVLDAVVYPPNSSNMETQFTTGAQAVSFGKTDPRKAAQAVVDAVGKP